MLVVVVGCGPWGMALAYILSEKNKVVIVSSNPDKIKSINIDRVNPVFSELNLPLSITATDDVNIISKADLCFLVFPARFVEEFCKKLFLINAPNHIPIVLCNKGIGSKGGFKLLSDVVGEFLSNPLAILSGPNFAHEVIKRKPCASDLSCENMVIAKKIIAACSSEYFALHHNSDMIGTQLGGIYKNIVAIACGVVHGLELGDNYKSFIINLGYREMCFLGNYMNANSDTFLGLSGIGDLFLTCSSLASRNMTFGYKLAKKEDFKYYPEGYYTIFSLYNFTKSNNIKMPLLNFLYEVVYNKGNVLDILQLVHEFYLFE